MMTAWLAGAYPDTHFLTFITIMTPLHVIYRSFILYEHKSIFFLTDFCYYSTTAFLYFINFDPKNETLFRMCYVHANGSLAVAIFAFNTQFIVHNPNNLTGMFIHAIPFVTTNLIRWKLIPAESHLPEDERIWPSLSCDETWTSYLYFMFLVPVCFYLAWLAFYVAFTMILCNDYIKRNGMITMTINFDTPLWKNKLVDFIEKTSKLFSRLGLDTDKERELCWLITFVGGHIVYNVSAVFLSWINYRVFYLMLCFNSFWIMRAFYNGANYYMTRFSAHYEKQLARLEELEK